MEALSRKLLPRDSLGQIRCFTAKVSARPNDPDAPTRQATYIRALRTLPMISIHFGSFRKRRTPSADAHFFMQIRTSALAGSQFPTTMNDAAGQFHKPASW